MTQPTSETDFKVIQAKGTAVVQLPPRLIVLEAVAFKQTFQQLLQDNSVPEKIIFDFSKTTFIDSSGVGALVSNLKHARQEGIPLLLRGVTPPVKAVLSLTGLDQVLTFEADKETSTTTAKVSETLLPTTHPSVRSRIKRFLDILGSIVGLVLTSIVFLPIVIAIKLDSPGPIFFSQTRLGWMGKPFKIWKFRSMCVDAEALKEQIENQADGKVFKNENDPRITKVGRFLRKTSLDELPQFWNVLKGEMSLVGTRPPTPNEVDIYEVPEWQRLDVKPGMTGEWQVNGRSSIKEFEDIIKLDLRYQQNWNLLYDLKLIIKTILVVFNKESGAV